MADVIPIKPDAAPNDEPFRIGSTVCLAGGGAIMTVRKPGKSSVVVDWHDTQMNLCSAEFPPKMLRHADPDENEKSEA